MLKSEYKEFFKTLGNQQRIEVVLCLMDGDKSVSKIIECLGAEQSTVSHNLKRLLKCSFISVKPNGKERIYSVNEGTIKPLFALIEQHANVYCKDNCVTND